MDNQENDEIGAKLKNLMLNSANDSIFLHDFDGNFIYVNESAYKSAGYSKEEFMKMNLHDLDVPEHAVLINQRIKELEKKKSTIFEAAHLCKDGSVIDVEVNARIIESEGKKLILSIVRDITKRKE
ncbi:MAG: PAS domain S-box protein [Methanobacterium sp.]|nr:PAS domain S-box protein [Methanobacterium sp.]